MNIVRTVRSLVPLSNNMRSLFVQNARSLEKLKTSGVPKAIVANGRYMIFYKGTDRVLLDPLTKNIAWKSADCLPAGLVRVVLDVVEQDPQVCLFAVDYPGKDEGEASESLGGKFYDARQALFLLKNEESALVTQARGLINFCNMTNFCKFCGGKLSTSEAGTQKDCPDCKRTIYPTLSPVGIVLIEDQNHSKVLLVRGERHPRGMFSCVAGFVETGESLEGNIRREIAEEVGLDVENIEYCSSQCWAMPEGQLMLGCIATATSEDYELDPSELEGGQWVDAATLAEAVARAKLPKAVPNPAALWVPPPAAVAHTLMELWLKKYHNHRVNPASHI